MSYRGWTEYGKEYGPDSSTKVLAKKFDEHLEYVKQEEKVRAMLKEQKCQ